MPENGGEQSCSAVAEVVTRWLGDTSRLLQCVQEALEHARAADGAPPEAAALLAVLPPLIRECRTQIPTRDMIQVWVKLASDPPHRQSRPQSPPTRRASREVAQV